MTQLQRTKRLAQAFRKMDKAEAAYRAAQREFDLAFQPWAAGKPGLSRDEAREHLTSTGYIERRKVCE